MSPSSGSGPTDVGGRHGWLIVGAALLTGAAGALTLIVSERYLGLEAMAPLAQLWTMWAVLAAALTFAFQQWAALNPVGVGALLRPSQRSVLMAVTAVSVVLFTVSTIWRESIFQTDSLAWPLAAAALPFGTTANGTCRGVLARRGRLIALAAAISGENLIRLAVVGVLVIVGADAEWFAVSLLAGFAVVLLAVGADDVGDEVQPVRHGALGASAVAGFLGHAFMFGSPLLLAFAGGSPTSVAALFLVLTGVRVPFVILQALVPRLTVTLSTAADPAVVLARTRRTVVVAAVVAAPLVGVGAALLGDLIIGSAFGIRGEVGRGSYALLAMAAVLAVCAMIATVALVVEARSHRIVAAWSIAAVSGLVLTAFGAIDEVLPLSIWLACAHATVLVVAVLPGGEGRRLDGWRQRSRAMLG